MKVLHVLEKSAPDTGGYIVRASSIVEFQRRCGMEPVVVTSPLLKSRDRSVEFEYLDGVPHYRTNHIARPASARSKIGSYGLRALMLHRYRRAVLDVALRERPDVLHAHSSYLNAFAAFPAAERLRIPIVYEVRTLWGESAVVEDGWQRDSWKLRLVWRLELEAMRRADLVVPIAKGIRDELMRRGVPERKLAIVPNGVDSARFVPRPPDEGRARAAGVAGSFVVGFVGTIRRLEGLSTLLQALARCQGAGRDISLVVVGDGPDRAALEAEAGRLGLAHAVFTGRVPHADVESYYSIMDVLVYPRIRAVINERVTPLKPLEAMALGKICLGSDVGGLTELIHDGRTGVVFRSGDPADLASKIGALMDDPARMARLRGNALEYARTERDWNTIAPGYKGVYERARRQAS